jgi:hypothetical protein
MGNPASRLQRDDGPYIEHNDPIKAVPLHWGGSSMAEHNWYRPDPTTNQRCTRCRAYPDRYRLLGGDPPELSTARRIP